MDKKSFMNRHLIYPEVTVAGLLLLFTGCAPPLTMNSILYIERGMSASSFSTMVRREPARLFKVVDPASGLEYLVRIFPMQTGTYITYTP